MKKHQKSQISQTKVTLHPWKVYLESTFCRFLFLWLKMKASRISVQKLDSKNVSLSMLFREAKLPYFWFPCIWVQKIIDFSWKNTYFLQSNAWKSIIGWLCFPKKHTSRQLFTIQFLHRDSYILHLQTQKKKLGKSWFWVPFSGEQSDLGFAIFSEMMIFAQNAPKIFIFWNLGDLGHFAPLKRVPILYFLIIFFDGLLNEGCKNLCAKFG